MSWYRKTDIRMYGDEKFRRLSSPQPNGQTLWQYLFTGPHTESLPGLTMIGERGLAEALGWTLKGFREAFREVFREGMAKADWEARVVYLPNVIKYDPPESPNVIIGWMKYFDLVPECALKTEWAKRVNTYLDNEFKPKKGDGEAFREAFRKAFAEALREPFAKGIANPQPQPQPQPYPQLQEDICAEPEADAARLSHLLSSLIIGNDPAVESKHTDRRIRAWAADIEKIHRLDKRPWSEIEDVIRWSQDDDFWRTNILSASKLRKQFSKLLLQTKRNPSGSKQSATQKLDMYDLATLDMLFGDRDEAGIERFAKSSQYPDLVRAEIARRKETT